MTGVQTCALPIWFNDREAAREVAKQKHRRKKALRKVQEAELRITAREIADKLPLVDPPERPETRLIEPLFTKKKMEKQRVDDDERFGKAVSMMKPAKKSYL